MSSHTTRESSPRTKKDDNDQPEMPLEVSRKVSGFDRFAKGAADFSSNAWFFTFCVLLVVVWAPTYFLLKSVDTWQLIINTGTTIITFLMVALIQNSQTRAENALQHKLNAIAQALGDLMEHMAETTGDGGRELAGDLHNDLAQLRSAVGLEEHESSSGNKREEGSQD